MPPVAWVVLSMIAFFGMTAPGFFTAGNFLNITLQGSVLLILAVAATLVILTEGHRPLPGQRAHPGRRDNRPGLAGAGCRCRRLSWWAC